MTERRDSPPAAARETRSPGMYDPVTPLARVDVLGIGVHAVDFARAASYLDRALHGAGRTFVITANPEFVVLARRDRALHAAADQADLVVPDGVGLVLAARILGRPVAGRARGRDLVLWLAERAQRLGLSLYLLGAGEGIADRAAAALRLRHPGLRVAGTYAGSPDPSEDEAIVGRVNASAADVLLVAYGQPRQELWISRNLARLAPRIKVVVGVGGTFDYLAGEAPLPPDWIARAGFEWLWRLAHQRWRWRRQIALPIFLMLVLRERIRAR